MSDNKEVNRVCALCGKGYSKDEHNYICFDKIEYIMETNRRVINTIFRDFVCGECLDKFIILKDSIIEMRKKMNKLVKGGLDTGLQKDKGVKI